jgi:hypothetical protein
MKPLRDIAVEALGQLLTSAEDKVVVDEMLGLFEGLLAACTRPASGVWSESWSDHLRFFNREVWLYALAGIIRTRRWAIAQAVLSTRLCTTLEGGYQACDYGRLDGYLRTLEDQRNGRLKLNRISLTADLVKERADIAGFDFVALQEVDFLLCLRGVLPQRPPHTPTWYPRTAVYSSHFPSPFPIFVRWQANRDTDALQPLLSVKSRKDLYDGLVEAAKAGDLKRYTFDHFPLAFGKLAALDDLDSR